MKGKRKQVACHFKMEKDTAQKLDQRIKRSGFASRTECKKYTLLDIMHQPDNKRISDKKTTERMTGKLLHSFPKKLISHQLAAFLLVNFPILRKPELS